MSPFDILRIVTLPFILLGELFGIEIGREKGEKTEKPPLKVRILSLPNNLVMAAKSSWRSRERVLAVFAGVFLASLVISTVLAYGVGLSQAFLQYSLQEEIFDAKVDFADNPGNDAEGRTNDSLLWESMCDGFVEMEEFSDCGLVYGRQGVRVDGFFDEDFIIPQPLNVIAATGPTGDWGLSLIHI